MTFSLNVYKLIITGAQNIQLYIYNSCSDDKSNEKGSSFRSFPLKQALLRSEYFGLK